MFVSDLDRPWHQTPFPIQGFYIRSQNDIRALVSHCKWVMVDVAESRDSVALSKGTGKSLRNASTSRTNGREELRSEEHTSELQSRPHLVCRLLLEKKKKNNN